MGNNHIKHQLGWEGSFYNGTELSKKLGINRATLIYMLKKHDGDVKVAVDCCRGIGQYTCINCGGKYKFKKKLAFCCADCQNEHLEKFKKGELSESTIFEKRSCIGCGDIFCTRKDSTQKYCKAVCWSTSKDDEEYISYRPEKCKICRKYLACLDVVTLDKNVTQWPCESKGSWEDFIEEEDSPAIPKYCSSMCGDTYDFS